MAALKRGGEIDAFVRRPDPAYPVVLVYGPNGGLVRERADRLAGTAAGADADAFQLVRLDGDDIAGDPLRLADEANTIGPVRRAAHHSRACGKPQPRALRPAARQRPAARRARRDRGRRPRQPQSRCAFSWKGAKAAHGPALLRRRAPRPRRACSIEMLAEAGLRIGRDARDALSGHLGADRQLARREIEKLVLYCAGQQEVDAGRRRGGDGRHSRDLDRPGRRRGVLGDAARRRPGRGRASFGGRGCRGRRRRGPAPRHDPPPLARGAGRRREMEDVERAARLFFKRKPAFQRQVDRWSATALEGVIGLLRDAQASCRRQAALGPAILARALMTMARRACADARTIAAVIALGANTRSFAATHSALARRTDLPRQRRSVCRRLQTFSSWSSVGSGSAPRRRATPWLMSTTMPSTSSSAFSSARVSGSFSALARRSADAASAPRPPAPSARRRGHSGPSRRSARAAASGSATESSARAWPAVSSPSCTRAFTGSGSLQQPQRVGDVAAALADDPGEIVLGVAELADQLLVAQRLLERVEVGALHVLDDRELERLAVVAPRPRAPAPRAGRRAAPRASAARRR